MFGIEAKDKTRTEQKRRPGLKEKLESFPLLYLELKCKEFYITDKSRVMRKYVYCRVSETISGSILMTENISKTMNYPLSFSTPPDLNDRGPGPEETSCYCLMNSFFLFEVNF